MRHHAVPMAGLGVLVAMVAAAPAAAQAAWTPDRPDAFLSISLLGHPEVRPGAFQFGYMYDTERFRDYRVAFLGTVLEPVTAEQLLAFYPQVPKEMARTAHQFTLAYAPIDGLVFDARVPLLSSSMDVLTNGPGFSLSSSGIGDVQANASLRVFLRGRHRVDLHVGATFPTGALTVGDAGIDSLPYAMRNGIGTVAWYPGVTYQGQSNAMSWGLQLAFVLPTGTNDRSYRMGHTTRGDGWIGGNWNRWLSSGARLTWRTWDEPTGADPVLDTLASPLNRTSLLGGKQLDLWFNSSVRLPAGALEGARLFAEFGFPLYLELNTLRSRWALRAGAAIATGGRSGRREEGK